jgi:hypothetical protein
MKKEPSDEFYGKIDYTGDIFFTLVKIADLSTHIFESPRSEWQKNALNYYTAVEFLETLVSPYLSQKEYFDHVYTIISEVIARYKKYSKERKKTEQKQIIKQGIFADVMVTIEIANIKLRLIVSELKRLQLLISQQYKAIY